MSQSIATSLIQSYEQSGDRADKQAIELTSRRSSRQSGDRADNQVNLKKLEKFLNKMPVSAESVVQGHQKSVKLARPLDGISLLRR